MSKIFHIAVLFCIFLKAPVLSEEIPSDEALFVRRILEFWKDKEELLVKAQIKEFLTTHPKSIYSDSLLVILGDTLWKEKSYSESLQAYDAIVSHTLKEKVFNNRLDCLYHIKQYQKLVEGVESKLANRDEKILPQEHNLWLYYKAEALLQLAKQQGQISDSEQYTEIEALFKKLLNSEHGENARLALIEMELALGNQETAVNYYLELAQHFPEKKEHMLFEAAKLQASYAPAQALVLLEEVQKSEYRSLAAEAAIHKLALLFEEAHYQKIVDEQKELEKVLGSEHKSILDYHLGRSFFALKNYENTIAYLKPLLKTDLQLSKLDTSMDRTILSTLSASAYHLNDVVLIQEMAKRFKTSYPTDPSYVKILYLKGLTSHRAHRFSEALIDFEQIIHDYPDFEKMPHVLFEVSVLLYKTDALEQSHQSFLKIIEHAPEPSLVLASRQYLPHISLQILEKAEAKGGILDPLREQLLSDLTQALDTPGVLQPSERIHYLLKMSKLHYDMQKYSKAQEILFQCIKEHPNDENIFQAHLLMAMCCHENEEDPLKFAFHAEKTLQIKPDFPDQCRLRLNLFNTYLQMGNDLENAEYTDKAAVHLYQVFKLKSDQIKPENKLWLANYFYKKVKEKGHEYFVEPMMLQSDLELAYKAALVYRSAFGLKENLKNSLVLTEENIHLEHELFKLSNLYGWLNSPKSQIKVLDNLIELQQKYPSWNWALRTRTLFAKANALRLQGDFASALNLYSTIIHSSKSTDPFVLNASKLRWADLSFVALPKEKRVLEDSEILSILNTLKNLQIRKNLACEPIHLEAALEYARIRSSLEPKEKQKEHYSFLLKRIKEDFSSQDDMRSKDYHACRQQNSALNEIYQAYMLLLEGHLARLDAQEANQKGEILETENKKTAAQKIYHLLLTERFVVSKYLVDQAKTGLEILKTMEADYDPAT